MFKLLFMGVLIYYAYRMFVPPTRLDGHYPDDRFDNRSENNNNTSSQEDEYIDYEEVD